MKQTDMDMDKFMDDFLDGVYLIDPVTTTSRKNRPSHKSHGDDVAAPPMPSLRRNKTSGDETAAPRRGVRRTKSTDGASLPAGPSRGVRRTKSGQSSRKPSRKKEMDPSEVLRMLEMYADLGEDGMAEQMMRKMKEKDASTEAEPRTAGLPNAIHVTKAQ